VRGHRDGDEDLRAAWAASDPGTPHGETSSWEALIEGRLDATAREALLDHVASCPRCAGVYRHARKAALDAVRAERKAEKAAASRPPLARPWLAPVAAVLATATAVVVLSRQAMAPSAPPGSAATAPAVTPASAAPVTVATASATTASSGQSVDFPIEKPPVLIAAERLLAQRGRVHDEAWLASFARALEPYRADDFKEASRLLAVVADQRKDAPEPAFYLGVSLLLGGRPAEAVAPLDRALRLVSEARRSEVALYLGCAQALAGDHRAAHATLKGACEAKGRHAAQACAALRHLDESR
jgi:hypothetical protein